MNVKPLTFHVISYYGIKNVHFIIYFTNEYFLNKKPKFSHNLFIVGLTFPFE